MSGSWPGRELPLQSTQTRARTQTGALNLTPSPSLARNNGRQNAGKFYLLNVDTSLFVMAFQSKWDNDSLCIGQTAQAIYIRGQCGTALHCRAEDSLEPNGKVMRKAAKVWGDRRDSNEDMSHVMSMCSINIRFALMYMTNKFIDHLLKV